MGTIGLCQFANLAYTLTMSITVRAYAKLNLTLEVLNRREDGYHEIASVMQSVSMGDTLTVAPAQHLTLECSIPELENEENLAYRAAKLLRDSTGTRTAATLTLTKEIPTSSGMGGGSADAAAALWALNRLWDLNLPPEALQVMAGQLGSDVPFFLTGGTALATGRGEAIKPLTALADQWFLMVRPPIEVADKTATLYAKLRSYHHTSNNVSQHMVKVLDESGPLHEILFQNAFDYVAPYAYAEIGTWLQRTQAITGARPHLTGSGPAFFVLIASQSEGEAFATALTKEGAQAFVVQTVPHAIELIEAEEAQ